MVLLGRSRERMCITSGMLLRLLMETSMALQPAMHRVQRLVNLFSLLQVPGLGR